MSISRKVKNEALSMHSCSPELLIALLEQRCNVADGERALVHLANCPECRAKAAFVIQAMATEKDGTFPCLPERERQATLAHVNDLLEKNIKSNQQILWDFWLANHHALSLLKGKITEPEVLAAGAESAELYFRSTVSMTSPYFWQAALCIGNGTEEMLKISLTDGNGKKIAAGYFLFCLIKTKVKDGVCFVNKEEFAENLFSENAARHSVAFRFPDKTIVAGQPVLGTIL